MAPRVKTDRDITLQLAIFQHQETSPTLAPLAKHCCRHASFVLPPENQEESFARVMSDDDRNDSDGFIHLDREEHTSRETFPKRPKNLPNPPINGLKNHLHNLSFSKDPQRLYSCIEKINVSM